MLGHHDRTSTKGTIRSNIISIVNHPQYGKGTSENFDLSLVKLETKIDFTRTPNVRPICLPKNDDNDFAGNTATVSGWGKVHAKGNPSNVLREVDVKVIGDESCRNDFQYSAVEITDQMLCARAEGGGKDSCTGDSGNKMTMSYVAVLSLTLL